MARFAAMLALAGLTLVLGLAGERPTSAQQDAAKKPGQKKGKAKRPAEAADGSMPVVQPAMPAPSDDGVIRFSRDIAPLLVANCQGCHNDRQKRGNFDQTSFASLMKGGKGGPVIDPGKPADSRLVLRIKGEGDEPKMPPGQRTLAPETVARISQWVSDGAKLDDGVDPNAKMSAYAPSAADKKKADLAKMSAEDRDKRAEKLAIERFKKAKPDANPAMISDPKATHLLAFGAVPKDRTLRLLQAADKQYLRIQSVLSRDGKTALDFGEKVSLYLFKDTPSYVEFVRAVEGRDVEPGTEAHAKFDGDAPYIAAIDPLHGGEESAAATKKAGKSKKGGAEDGERTLAGVVTEQLAAGGAVAAGKPPRWLSQGFGALMASSLEPRSFYYRKLRDTAFLQQQLGWQSKANDALGDEGDPEKVKAIGFAVVEFVANNSSGDFAPFVRGMLEGREKLDKVLAEVLQGNRDTFLQITGTWVQMNYARR